MAKRSFRWTNCSPDTIISPPYSYGSSGYNDGEDFFRMGDIDPATPDDLQSLFYSTSKQKEPTKKWYTTQLHFYGVSSKKTATRPELRQALKSAYDVGRCQELAPAITVIRNRLRRQYDDALKQLEDEQFASLNGNMSSEVNSDPPRFIAKYFLDAQGRPDQGKTKAALSLEAWNRTTELRELVASISSLRLITANRRILIGWDNTMEKGIENEFKRIKSSRSQDDKYWQAEQANVSIELFLAINLGLNLDVHHSPLGTTGCRPSTPVILSDVWLSDENKKIINNLAGTAPDLVMKKHSNYQIIGWDAAKVNAEIDSLKAEEKRMEEEAEANRKKWEAEEEAENKARWHKLSKPHRELVAKLERKPSRPVFGLPLLYGKYIVRYQHEDDGLYGEYNGSKMALNIFPADKDCRGHGLVASFDFGNIEGMMLLGMSRDKVVLLREGLLKDYRDYDPADWDQDDEDEAESYLSSSTIAFGFGHFPSSNFTSQHGHQLGSLSSTTTDSATVIGTKRPAPAATSIADPFGVLAARAKRQRMMEEANVKTENPSGIPQDRKIKQEHNDSSSLAAIPPAPTMTRFKKEEPEASTSTSTSSLAPPVVLPPALPEQRQPTRRRIFFQLAYNDKGGWPDIDDNHRQVGHFDFDELGAKADGVFRLPSYEQEIERLSIYKVSETPDQQAQPGEWGWFFKG
ncbi:hypothetical protein QBC37DRAFT_462875 [Rhypophila decipiens]|uniref:Uncharacterized protein n=1 Tax=Rhypophila decipiens TaxID=261697 RepID=A0AAN6Y9R9_9PEZI|nr:hypothetical protein QBC37DRAFT_462875 [Rhypophila decipiens]